MEQRFYSASDDDKRRVLVKVLRDRQIRQAFVFVNSKLGCARLTRSLERDGLRAAALHGDKSQDERLKALEAFKQGEVDLLVCTDVAARGLDIKDVPAVFNFDVPFNAEDYVHRIGRTGRAGASGLAVTLVTGADARHVSDIEKLTKKKIDVEPFALDERPQRDRFNDGHRERREREGRDVRRERERDQDEAPQDRRERYRPAPVSRDPFFDKPYVAKAAEPAAWDASSKPAPARGAASVKPRRKVAALFKPTPTSD